MAHNVKRSQKFIDDFNKEIDFLKTHGCPDIGIANVVKDINNELHFIEDNPFSDILLGSIKDYNYTDRRFFVSNKYKYRIYVKPYPEQNMIKAVCLLNRWRQFQPNMFVEQQMFVEQLRQTYKELGGDYDEATRQYLAEQARRALMSDVDIIIEDICRR